MWAGIRLRGPTQIVIFDGIMDAPLYVEVLRQDLLPFLAEKFPNGHRFMQVCYMYSLFIFNGHVSCSDVRN